MNESRRGARKGHPKGIFQTPHGWRAYIRVSGKLYSDRFPPDTPIKEMQLWRDETRLRALGRIPQSASGDESSFESQVRIYLDARADMPTYAEREQHMEWWLSTLGRQRQTSTIAAIEIRKALAKLKTDGYANNSVNHRRSALSNFFTVSGLPNPVREVPRYRDTSKDAPPRALSLSAIDALFSEMDDCATKARLEFMRWTGWPQKLIGLLKETSVDWDLQLVYAPAREKGRGVAGGWTRLLPPAWTALKEMAKWSAFGEFSPSSMRKFLRRSAERVRARDKETGEYRYAADVRAEVANVTPYQLRHSFGTTAALITKDDRAVQTLLRHADGRQALRYSKQATDPRTDAALDLMALTLGITKPTGNSGDS